MSDSQIERLTRDCEEHGTEKSARRFSRRLSNDAVGESKNVVVAGIGAVSAAGANIQANFDSMLSAKRNISPSPSLFECEFTKPVFECASTLTLNEELSSERTLALALKALDEALSDAHLATSDLKGARVGVALGSTVACMLNSVDFYSDIKAGISPDPSPLRSYINGDISERVASKLGATGPRSTVANACSSGANAISIAFSWLQSGLCDIVVAGGADELSLIPYCGFNSLQIMGNEPCVPFDADRGGLTLGEGAGILILETRLSAERRGATPKAVLAACGCASDAYHLTGPHPDGRGLKRAVTQALRSVEASPAQVDYVNAHGTATPDNDRVEGTALFEIFGDDLRYSSTKYYTGHTLAAAGAIEAAICVAGLNRGVFPGSPVIKADPLIPIPPTFEPISHRGGLALSTSMAFGGTCVALLFAPFYTEEPVAVSATRFKTDQDKVATPEEVSPQQERLVITSLGVIGPFGRGVQALRSAMKRDCSKSSTISNAPLFVPGEIFKTPEFRKFRRRADKISLMALAAASDAIEDANLAECEVQDLTVIFVTAFGAHTATFKFLDSLLDYGQCAPSPTSFSNSVHNAPTFYITRELGILGASTTMTSFRSSFRKALLNANSLLNSRGCERVLLVAGDEVDETMLRISDFWYENLGQATPGWGEGAVAFLLKKGNGAIGTSTKNDSTVPAMLEESASFAALAKQTFGHTLLNDAFASAIRMVSDGE